VKQNAVSRTTPRTLESTRSRFSFPLFKSRSLKAFASYRSWLGEITWRRRRSSRGSETVYSSQDLVIVSSDFTHYGFRFGYTPSRTTWRKTYKLDFGALDQIKKLSPKDGGV